MAVDPDGVYLDPTFIKKTRFDRQEKKMDPDPTLEKHPDPQPLSGPGWSLPGSELYKKKNRSGSNPRKTAGSANPGRNRLNGADCGRDKLLAVSPFTILKFDPAVSRCGLD